LSSRQLSQQGSTVTPKVLSGPTSVSNNEFFMTTYTVCLLL